MSLVDNPFHVLEVAPDASAVAVERAGQRLLAMLAVGMAGADRYTSAIGPRPRDAELVRRSVERLRDPVRRAEDAAWARVAPLEPEARFSDPAVAPWPEARKIAGFEPERA